MLRGKPVMEVHYAMLGIHKDISTQAVAKQVKRFRKKHALASSLLPADMACVGCRSCLLSPKSTRRNPRLGAPDICYVTYRNNKLRG